MTDAGAPSTAGTVRAISAAKIFDLEAVQRVEPALGGERPSVRAGPSLQLLIVVDVEPAEPVGERAADRGLARSHQADEHDVPRSSSDLLRLLPVRGCSRVRATNVSADERV